MGWDGSVTSGGIPAKDEKPTVCQCPRQSREPRAQHTAGTRGGRTDRARGCPPGLFSLLLSQHLLLFLQLTAQLLANF